MAGHANADEGEFERLDYPACPGAAVVEWTGWVEAEGDDAIAERSRGARMRSDTDLAGESEAVKRSFERGRAQGREEGRQLEQEVRAAELGMEKDRHQQQLAALTARFAEASEHYLHEVEREVVKLALAVASRILRREAQMDPLLLTGAVRVALGQLAASSEVRLLVPKAELELWQEAIAHLPNLATKPAVAAADGLRLGDCVIESQVGTVNLGVPAQLAEIERGFFDRAPAAQATEAAVDAGREPQEARA